MMEPSYFDVNEKVKSLIRSANGLPDGKERIALLEEAVQVADTGTDLRLQYEAREEFLEAAYFGGEPKKALVAFAWCLAQSDRNPGTFYEWRLLWRYKWMVNVICSFPQISLEQIYEMLDDMESRYRRAGRGLRPIYRYRYRTEKFLGNRQKAIDYFHRAEEFPRDDLTDCQACETDEQSSFHLYCGRDEQALIVAEPIIQGRHVCRSVPQRTYARLLLPLLRMGRRARAWEFHLSSYYKIEHDPLMLDYLCDQILFLSLYGDLEGAASIFEKHYHWTELNTNAYEHFLFYRAGWLLCELAGEAGMSSLDLRMPRSFPLFNPSHFYETERLKQCFEERARELAQLFDSRNGNDYFTKKRLDIAALKRLETV